MNYLNKKIMTTLTTGLVVSVLTAAPDLTQHNSALPGLRVMAAGSAQEVGKTSSKLLGDARYADDCTPDQRKYNETILKYGRIAAVSTAFEECVRTKLKSLYRKCKGDPGYDRDIESQIQMVLEVTRSANILQIKCTGGSGNASSAIGTYGHVTDEAFSWGGWFGPVYNTLGRELCSVPPSPGCRWKPDPWPYSQAAGIVWHEAMHTHGYTHGANNQPAAIVNCGYAGDPTWHFQANTMPYIIGDCIAEVIDRSGSKCGDLNSCADDNKLKLIGGYTSTLSSGVFGCECIKDPRTCMPGPVTDITLTGVPGWNTMPVACSNGSGMFIVTNRSVGEFGTWASRSSALEGDFNGDGRTDVALTGGPGWATLPVALSNGDGSFKVTNQPVGEFAPWAAAPGVKALTGDFNGDGKTDVALVRGSGWATLPVAFSKGDGNFRVTNQPVGEFAAWAAKATVLVGDFNGDGKSDIALTGVPGWATLPVAFSNGDGSFRVTNQPVGEFAAWAAAAGAKAVTGDFNKDGKTDIALTGGRGWATLPVAFSMGDGSFRVTNRPVGGFADWAAAAGAKPVTGDFNGDGKPDVALTGGPGWNTLPVAFSNGDGSFTISNQPIGEFAAWAAQAMVLVGDFNGDGKSDIALTGAAGWTTLPVAFATKNGSFKVTNQPISEFAAWAASPRARALTGNFK